MRTLLGLEDRLGDLRKARKGLQGLEDPKLPELDDKLGVIRYLLGTAETAEDLDTAAKEIQGAAKTTAELWEKLHPETPYAPLGVLRQAFLYRPSLARYAAIDWRAEPVSDEAVVIDELEVSAAAPSQPPPLPQPPPQPQLDAKSAEAEIGRPSSLSAWRSRSPPSSRSPPG